MIPFARMIQYGNVVQQNKIVKIDNNVAAGVLLLSSTGDLYGFGPNGAYQLGLGHNNAVTTPTLLFSGVKNFWSAGGDTVLQTTDDKFYAAGVGNIIDAANTSRHVWTDITYVFSAVDISDIKKVDIKANCLAVLTNSGNLYCAGYNGYRAYNSNNAIRYANLTLIRSDIVDIKGNYNLGLFTLRTDGKIYAGGYSTSGQLGTSAEGQAATTIIYGTQAWTYADLDCLYTHRTGTLLNNTKLVTGTDSNALKMRISGANTNGSLAAGAASVGFTAAWGSANTLAAADIISGFDTSANATGAFLLTSTGLWSTGNNQYGQMGRGNTSNQVVYSRNSTMDSIVTDYSKLTVFNAAFYSSYFVYDNKLYGAGAVGVTNAESLIPGYSNGSSSYVEIQLPF